MNRFKLLVFASITFLAGCHENPFDVRYLSPTKVEVHYQDGRYLLDRLTSTRNLPFSYAFERDGDLDLTVAGRTYEFDSPYDVDRPKKKKKLKKYQKKY